MRKESKILLEKATNSIKLCVELFNRPSDEGRIEGVLILLNHALEMLIKSAIIHKGGSIKQDKNRTIPFDKCIQKSLSDEQFIVSQQALTLQLIYSHRNEAQHYFISIPEEQLYILTQSGLSLFKEIYETVFTKKLNDIMSSRVLPISTIPLSDINAYFSTEIEQIKKLIKPGNRKTIEAKQRIKAITFFDKSLQGEDLSVSDSDINKIIKNLKINNSIDQIFPGLSSIQLTSNGYGPSFDLKITTKEGVPVRLTQDGDYFASIAVKRVDELGFYNLNFDQLSQKLELNKYELQALVWYLELKTNPDCFKMFNSGKLKFGRYSQKAIELIKSILESVTMQVVIKSYKEKVK